MIHILPEINALLEQLKDEISHCLGESMVGVYVHGSLAGGDFHPQRSDIDFLVVTRSELNPTQLESVQAVHRRLVEEGNPWAKSLEGSYIPLAALRRYDPAHAAHPALRVDGSFAIDHHASDWILQRHVLRERGICMAGPDLRELIDPITPDELRHAARGILQEWWAPMVEDSTRLQSRCYQTYAVLTMCRSLYTIQHGEVVSKTQAAGWTIEQFQSAQTPDITQKWMGLIESAIRWPEEPQPDQMEETRDLILYTLEQAGLL